MKKSKWNTHILESTKENNIPKFNINEDESCRCFFDVRNTNNPEDPKYEQEDMHGGHIVARMDFVPGDDLKISFKEKSSDFKGNGINMMKIHAQLEDQSGRPIGIGYTNFKVRLNYIIEKDIVNHFKKNTGFL